MVGRIRSVIATNLYERLAVIVTGTVLLVALAGLAVVAAPEITTSVWYSLFEREELDLKIGFTRNERAYGYLSNALAKEVSRIGPFKLTAVPADSQKDVIERVGSGELEFAVVQGGVMLKRDKVLAIARVVYEFVHVVVPVDSPIKTFSDLAGKQVGTGLKGSGSHQIAERLIAMFDFNPSVELLSIKRSELDEAMDSGTVAAVIFVTPLVLELGPVMATGRYRLVAIPQAEIVSRQLDGGTAIEIPMGTYGHNRSIPPKPVPTLAVNGYIVTNADVDDAPIFRILEDLYSVRLLRHFDFAVTRRVEDWGKQVLEIPLHPAAVSYYSRDEPVSADQFEIGAFFLGLMLAVLAGVRYIFMWMRRRVSKRHREQIRGYIESMAVLDAQLSTAEPEEYPAILNRMMALEFEAEQHWLAGEISTEDMENFYERTGAKVRNAYIRLLDHRLLEILDKQDLILNRPSR